MIKPTDNKSRQMSRTFLIVLSLPTSSFFLTLFFFKLQAKFLLTCSISLLFYFVMPFLSHSNTPIGKKKKVEEWKHNQCSSKHSYLKLQFKIKSKHKKTLLLFCLVLRWWWIIAAVPHTCIHIKEARVWTCVCAALICPNIFTSQLLIICENAWNYVKVRSILFESHNNDDALIGN